jgi:NADPH:quinone reductase-like Zn-dependent oxidoreductase
VSQSFPLEDAAAAHRAIMGGHTLGKIALVP